MERDPLGLVWRTTPALHLWALGLLLAAVPLGWFALDLLRIAVDDAINGNAFRDAPTAPFLRLALPVPQAESEGPLLIAPGFTLTRAGFGWASAASSVALAVVAALLALLAHRIRSRIAERVGARLRMALVEGLLNARPAAAEEARQAASLAAEPLTRIHDSLGAAILTPLSVLVGVSLGLLYTVAIDWRLTLATAVALVALVLAWPRRVHALDRERAVRRREGTKLQRALDDLVRRLPALRAHGAAGFERERLAQDLGDPDRRLARAEREAGVATALSTLALLIGPTLVLGVALWLALDGGVTAGEAVAATAASGLGALSVRRLAGWERDLDAARPLLEDIARTLGTLQSRRRATGAALPGSGALAAQGLSGYEPSSGQRLPSLDLSVALPAHVALTGDPAAGARVFAAVIGGAIEPSSGRLTFGGIDLAEADPAERARRIAYAGGETILIAGSLRRNLLYGVPDPESPDAERRLVEAAAVVGLDGFVHASGLSGSINPAREPKLAAAIVDTRRAVRAALAARDASSFVEPFDLARYNRHATIGENILFGVPLGDTFREANLPSHSFVRAILEAEGLTKMLTAMGLSIAASLVEIFADIPDGHPLFERFSFFSAAERGFFEDLLGRQNEGRRNAARGRDQERLISLALRYSESRHRLGLLDPEIEARLVAARAAFANLLPASLKPAIEFYDPGALCAAASVMDNLLFGRVAQDRAGAEAEVVRVVRRVLTDRGLDQDVFRIGLDARIDPRAGDFSASELAAIEVARCLARKPDVVVVEHALDGLAESAAEAFVERLRRALIGRGLIIVTPELTSRMDSPPFDFVLRFDRGEVSFEDRRHVARPTGVAAATEAGR
jgi:ABC-type multidrug transport system fused ATPase/permease subunit